jgi:hypothetical protein
LVSKIKKILFAKLPSPIERKEHWLFKGVKVDDSKYLRCPYCNKILCEGDYSDRPQKFKCKCGEWSEFQRLT